MALNMFMKISGATPAIIGESVDPVHPNEIDVLAWSWGVSNGGGGAQAQDLNFTTYYGRASIALMQACCLGTVFPSTTLTVVKPLVTPVDVIRIKLEEVTVTSDSTGGSGGEDRLTENFSFHFNRVRFTYFQLDGGVVLRTLNGGFDFVNNVKL